MINLAKVICFSALLILSACGGKKEKPAAKEKVTAASCIAKNQKLNAFGNKCLTECPIGESFNGTQCEKTSATCAPDLEFNGKTCVCKVSGEIPVDNNTRCIKNCAEGEKWDAKQKACIPFEKLCDKKTTVWDKTKQQCVGKKGTDNNGGGDTNKPDNGGGDTDKPPGKPDNGGSDTDKPDNGGGDTNKPPGKPDNGGGDTDKPTQVNDFDPATNSKLRLDEYNKLAQNALPIESLEGLDQAEVMVETITGKGKGEYSFVALNPLKITLKAGEVGPQALLLTGRVPQVKSRKFGWTYVMLKAVNVKTQLLAKDVRVWAGCLDAKCDQLGFKVDSLSKKKTFVFKAKSNGGDKYVLEK